MNKKVYIKQDDTIPGYRIIEELKSRGGVNEDNYSGISSEEMYYYISSFNTIVCSADPSSVKCLVEQGYTELLYNKETDSFYENTTIMTEGEYAIPEGYEATIENGKIIVRKKKWQPKAGDTVWFVEVVFLSKEMKFCSFQITWADCYNLRMNHFQTKEEAQAFCDKLNAAIKPILNERRKELGL